MGKHKNGKAAGKDGVNRKMIKFGGDMVVDWIWKLCHIFFENGVVSVTLPLYKGKRRKNSMYEL